MLEPQPTTLRNEYVTLRPIAAEDAQGYLAIGQDSDIWTYLAGGPLNTLSAAQEWIAQRQTSAAKSGDVVFSIFDNATGTLAGSSSYLEVRTQHGGLEIGWTWYGTAFQRSHVNTASKLALLTHAFEELQANRVQLQTDARNERSQRAIARIGAQREGLLRQHKIYPDGYVRDSVLFALTSGDWEETKARLVQRLSNP
ncbi:MAG: GNAT family protein [Pseudomonadota bacterium]